ncbi:hypothetical protein O9929_07770 [Vibrio lentus]|nr:hypothetical protein [Vibrio lentus]
MDGLAMSSRNSNPDYRRTPARTSALLALCVGSVVLFRGGRDDYASVIEDATDQLRAADLQP